MCVRACVRYKMLSLLRVGLGLMWQLYAPAERVLTYYTWVLHSCIIPRSLHTCVPDLNNYYCSVSVQALSYCSYYKHNWTSERSRVLITRRTSCCCCTVTNKVTWLYNSCLQTSCTRSGFGPPTRCFDILPGDVRVLLFPLSLVHKLLLFCDIISFTF